VTVEILVGDCREVLKGLPEDSVNCVVTSPPYYELRDYGMDDQIGLEKSPEEFVAELVGVFSETKRLLRDDGTVWVNLGDSFYSGNGQPTGQDPRSPSRNFSRRHKRFLDTPGMGYPKKSLLGMPWRFAHAMQRDGWTLRGEIIWVRGSAFLEAGVSDRPHRQHETIFLFSKSRRYFFDQSKLPEQSVWHIEPMRGLRGHSAAFPEEIPKRCIEAGCPDAGVVLDPFGGAGTTGLVANQLGRDAILIEINPEYAELARQRLGLFASAA
jgi:site-specific DNA-methyltransferase (adenine-specific)